MIKLTALTCGYNAPALVDIDLEFSRAEITVLLGPNGSGKSCLLETIVGKLSPLHGAMAGLPQKAQELARFLSYADQHPIEGHGLSVFEYFSLIEPKDRKLAQELVGYFELDQLLPRPLHALSGGQRQLVRICATLMQDSDYYFLDEPTNSLDPRPVELLLNLIKRMALAGKSFVVVSHELSFAVAVGERFIGLKDQKVLFDCEREELEDNRFLDTLFERRFHWFKAPDGRSALC